MFKQILENAIVSIEQQRAREIDAVKDRLMREVIAPHNNEINQSRDKAIAELNSQLTTTISGLQQKFSEQKQELYDAGEKEKKQFADVAIATETAIVNDRADKAIEKLKELINNIKE